jgi:hydroxyacylglutathione hydrolase
MTGALFSVELAQLEAKWRLSVLIKYFYDEKLAHASYLVGCQAAGEAIVIDPNRDVDTYVQAAEANNMRIVGATETHIHADFVSGARELAERTGSKLYLSDEGDANWKYQYLDNYDHQAVKDGDSFKVGNLRLDVLHTPGHTPEHISFLLTDGAKTDHPIGIFTGDFVFVGDIGRPDLLEEAAGLQGTADVGARQMYRSLKRFAALPDYLQVWPAHGAGSACGKALGAVPSTTVGYEKLFSWAFQFGENEEGFVEALLAGQPEAPKYFAEMKKVNKIGPKVLHGMPSPELLPASRLAELIAQRATVVDTRSAEEFAAGHVKGTINIPLASLAQWAGWLLDYENPFYLIIDPQDAPVAIHSLVYIGLDNAAGIFEQAAIRVLAQQGVQLETYDMASPDELADDIEKGDVVLVDVRGQSEWDESHIANAQHFMLGYLSDRSNEIINGKPIVVQCQTGVRAAIGASLLQAQGAQRVINMSGGIVAWQASGRPVTPGFAL